MDSDVKFVFAADPEVIAAVDTAAQDAMESPEFTEDLTEQPVGQHEQDAQSNPADMSIDEIRDRLLHRATSTTARSLPTFLQVEIRSVGANERYLDSPPCSSTSPLH